MENTGLQRIFVVKDELTVWMACWHVLVRTIIDGLEPMHGAYRRLREILSKKTTDVGPLSVLLMQAVDDEVGLLRGIPLSLVFSLRFP
jgi:hypothetical protein